MKQFRIIYFFFLWKLSYHDIKSTEIPPLENSFILDDWVNYEMIKNHCWVPNECMHVHVYIYRVTERQGHKMWNQSDIICQPPFVLCPYIQQLPKSLMRHRQLFHYQLISHNVLIRIWSALTGNILKRTWQLVAFIIFSTCLKNWITWTCFILNPTKFAFVEKYFCVLSEQNQDTMIISKVILFNQPWFQCYFLPQEA